MKKLGQGNDRSSDLQFVDTADFFVNRKLNWWDRTGPMKKLHDLNELRLKTAGRLFKQDSQLGCVE